jgi:hypothetical protein
MKEPTSEKQRTGSRVSSSNCAGRPSVLLLRGGPSGHGSQIVLGLLGRSGKVIGDGVDEVVETGQVVVYSMIVVVVIGAVVYGQSVTVVEHEEMVIMIVLVMVETV